MKKPYIVCHMMTSVDGRIDCAMTENLPGVQEYYETLDSLDAPTRVSGRVTAALEMALPGEFHAGTMTPLGKESFSKAVDADGYEVVMDTRGTLLWDNSNSERPPLIVMSEKVSREYRPSPRRYDSRGEFRRQKDGGRRRRAHKRRIPRCGASR